jgi:ATP-dependent Clp protease ATP-binding subunit ClpA
MIFMTSNVGASEMATLASPRVGYNTFDPLHGRKPGAADPDVDGRIARSGLAAARGKFSPEFINRLDKIVTFKALGSDQLGQILDIELNMVRQRVLRSSPEQPFMFELTGPAKALLLREGTDVKYGARHLKRAIERMLVQPLFSLIATHQVDGGDCVEVDLERTLDRFTFTKQAE